MMVIVQYPMQAQMPIFVERGHSEDSRNSILLTFQFQFPLDSRSYQAVVALVLTLMMHHLKIQVVCPIECSPNAQNLT